MSVTTKKETAGQLANKALADTTRYDALEVAYAFSEDTEKELYKAVRNYEDKIEENEFCVVMVLASDPLIHNLKRRKFYCWPWLPQPRPNQAVFLYNKAKGKIIKRLWVLPCAETMAILTESGLTVGNDYHLMRVWSYAFFNGNFWNVIRSQHDIKMLSQEEHFELHREELIQAKKDNPELFTPEPFDFSKISCGKVDNAEKVISD